MGTLLEKLTPGMEIVYGGDRVTRVSEELAAAFGPGDRLIVVQDTGELLHIPRGDWDVSASAVDKAVAAFAQMGAVEDDQITAFYESLASRLSDDRVKTQIFAANGQDVEAARERGRSTTRLVLTDQMLGGMIDGLRMWAAADAGRGAVIETFEHPGWKLDLVRSGLGVVGFVFEGRPNVLADATGVVRSGNTVVFRIGSAALGTARAVMENALDPALAEAGLPEGTVVLVDSASRASGWAMFSDHRLGLAVARGSGIAVAQLGSVARQTGIPVSLHGTGGSWIVVGETAMADDVAAAIFNSLDRKVCNTVNTVCLVESRSEDLIPAVLTALDRAGERAGATSKLHVTRGVSELIPSGWFEDVEIVRAGGMVVEPRTELLDDGDLGHEWEWEQSPEITLTVVPDVEEAVSLFNDQSPRFGASLISSDPDQHDRFFELIDAPFVGNGFTRWVDGQFALDRPELGLSNWQHGRLFGRGGILSGESVYTVRGRARQTDPDLSR